MTRKEYLEQLENKLGFLTEPQRKAILDYYEEMIDDRMEDGMDEPNAVVAMESPDTIAQRLQAEGTFAQEDAQPDEPENLTDEAMRFSSLAGSLLRTFDDLEKAGHVEPPVPPIPPVPTMEEIMKESPVPPMEDILKEPPLTPDALGDMADHLTDAAERIVESAADHTSMTSDELGDAADQLTDAVEKLVESAADYVQHHTTEYIQRHTVEATEGDYEKKTFTCPADKVRGVRLLCGEMPIRVTACDGNDLTLTYYTCDDDPYEMNLDDGVLTLERMPGMNASRFTFSILGGIIKMGWNKSAPTVELFLPRDALVDLTAHASNASVKVNGCQALCKVDLKSSNSRIEATELSCVNLSCTSNNGRLVIKNVRSRQQLSGKTSNARIEAGSLAVGGDIQLTTSNSGIEARGLQTFGSLTLTASNAHVLAEDCAAKGELRLTSSNGRLETWRCQAAAVHLRTSNAGIRGTLPGRQSDWSIESHTSNGKNSLPKQQPGSKPLTAHTSNGSIDLHFEEE